jgi:5-methylcytosine-specific restriction endonuclease McrA
MNYSDMLRDPRWQRKKTEVLIRDNFTCQHCNATDKTLVVHHIRYERGLAPWDYGNEYLLTLCDPCHSKHHDENPLLIGYETMPRCHVCRKHITNAQAYGYGDRFYWCAECAERHERGRGV